MSNDIVPVDEFEDLLGGLDDEDEALTVLSPGWRAFVEEYCTGARSGKPFKAGPAGLACGYQLSYSYQLIKKAAIRRAIEVRNSQLTMGKHEVLRRIQQIAEGEPGEVVVLGENGGLRIDPEKVMANRHLIKSFGFDANGNPKIEFYDKQAALRDIGKGHRLFNDGLDIGLNGQVNVEMTVRFVQSRVDGSEEDVKQLPPG